MYGNNWNHQDVHHKIDNLNFFPRGWWWATCVLEQPHFVFLLRFLICRNVQDWRKIQRFEERTFGILRIIRKTVEKQRDSFSGQNDFVHVKNYFKIIKESTKLWNSCKVLQKKVCMKIKWNKEKIRWINGYKFCFYQKFTTVRFEPITCWITGVWAISSVVSAITPRRFLET